MQHLKKALFTTLFGLLFLLFFFELELLSFDNTFSKQDYIELFSQGENFLVEGSFDKSIEFFKKSYNLAKKTNDKKGECESLIKLGILHWNVGKLKESASYYEQASPLSKDLNPKTWQDQIHTALQIYNLYENGKSCRDRAEYGKSIEYFQNAISLAEKIKSQEHKLKCLRQLASTYWELDNFSEFYKLNTKALDIAEELNHRKEQGRCLNNIGNYYWRLYNYSKALTHYEDSYEIAKRENDKEEEAICLTNIGIIYMDLGNYDQSEEYIKKAKDIDEQLGNKNYTSSDLNVLGEICRKKGIVSNKEEDFYEALDHFKKCLALSKEIKDMRTEVYALNNIGSVYSLLKIYDMALNYFELALRKAEDLEDIEAKGMILNNKGIVYFNQGNYGESTKCYDAVINLNLEYGGGKILWETYLRKADAHAEQKKFTEAIEEYKESIKYVEDMRSQIQSEEYKAKFLGTEERLKPYYKLIHELLTTQEPQNLSEAFWYLEKAKARAFLDELENSKIDISKDTDKELLNRERELKKDHSKLCTILLAAELDPDEKSALFEKLKEKEGEMESLKNEIRTKSPVYAALVYPEPITLSEAQAKLPDEKTALFEYCIDDNHSYFFVITKKDLRIFEIPKREEIKELVSDFLKAISDKENQNFQSGYKLFTTLVAPGLDESIKNIVFIPDDILYFLPFETLITDKAKNEWLIKKYNVAYVPSASSLNEIIQRKKMNKIKPKKDILAFGNPYSSSLETEGNENEVIRELFSNDSINLSRLKYSGLELDKINSLFTKASIFRETSASEDELKQHNLAVYKIIHFATHSIIDDIHPSRSSVILLMDKDPKEDGLLRMDEIYDLKLNSRLVTLSACETGLGEYIHGEGIVGLNRAFFYAGTSAVLMSLWAINDQASYQLTERFYHHLRSSRSIMDALRNAKLEMINSSALSHPYYWAGFIISGKADEVIFPISIHKFLILGISFLLAAGGVLIVIRHLKHRQ